MSAEVLGYLAGDAIRGIIVFQVVVLLVVLSNLWMLRRHESLHDPDAESPFVSVCVPCRNESRNVHACVRSLLAQTYPHIEFLALDDRSDDDTLSLLRDERTRDPRLQVLLGEQLPEGWTGKNWACHQLSAAARGDILLFADADTVFEPEAVDRIVRELEARKADLVSGIARQVTGTLGEKVLVPLFYWAFLSFTPLLVGLLRRAFAQRAIGQVMAFRRDAYDAVGGHAAVKGSIVEDLDLVKRCTRQGLVCRTVDVTHEVSCRMYRSASEAFRGFGKNLFAAFGSAVIPYVFVWAWLGYVYLEPQVLLAAHVVAPSRVPIDPVLLAVTISLALVQWVIAYARLRLPIWPAVLYPLTMVAFEVVAIGSIVASFRHTATWKGRLISGPPARWI